MAKFPRAANEKSAPRWIKGIYGGKTSSSDEHLVLTESGAQKYRTVRRLPVGSQYQKETFDKMRGAPWNAVLGITKSKPDAVVSKKALVSAPELASEEVYDFKEKPEQEQPLAIEIPAPMVRFQESKREDRKEPKEAASSKESKMTVDDEGEKVEIEEPDPKRVKAEAAGSGSAAASAGLPERYDIATPEDAQMSRRSTVEVEETEVSTAQDMIAAVAQNGEWRYAGEKRKTGGHYDKIHEYKKWLEKNGSYFSSSTLANIMDYLDNVTRDEEVLREARKEELRKLNEVYGAFKPRDRRELSKELTVFGHKWVDKVTEGIAKSRLICQDFKRKNQSEDKDSSETPSNFCPTPHEASKKMVEVYSLLHNLPGAKADLSSAFLIAKDQGDSKGQPVMMKPPQEWLEDYDVWLVTVSQPKEIQDELKDVPASEIVGQVDGNLYGRQSAAAQYRDRLEEILTEQLPKEKYSFTRGKLDACVYKCQLTGTVLIHHG